MILNGHFAPELSQPRRASAPASSPEASPTPSRTIAPEVAHLGQLAWEHAPFVALNTAFLEDGAFIVDPGQRDRRATRFTSSSSTAAPARRMAHPRTLIAAGANSQARIAQTFLGAAGECHFTNAVTEVSLGENATLDLYTDQRETDTAYHLAAMHVHLQRNATFRSRTVTLGGKLLRNDIVAVLGGEGAHCALDGCYLVDGDRLVDNHTTIDHATPHCTSHELYKGILDGKARAVFNGRIIVREDAQKTDAKQTNRALLLSDEAHDQLESAARDLCRRCEVHAWGGDWAIGRGGAVLSAGARPDTSATRATC